MNARTQAHAREADLIDQSQSRAIAARQAEQARPRSALEKMAMRLDLSPEVLRDTLRKTAFKGCNNNEEFVALVAVANEYNLNPMLKEIYAFPAKGGGIVPMVGYDGWVKLMNSHPQFDGIEYNDHLDSKGNLYGIEAVIYRKDRSHPIKLMELLEECRRGTEPWKMMPSRMLRNRVTCQAARLAFGFTGISVEGDDDIIDGGVLVAQTLPSRQTLAEELGDEIPNFDKRTGEIIDQPRDAAGRTVGSEEQERALDAGNDGTLSADNPTAAEGPADEQRGEAFSGAEQTQRAAAEQTMRDIDGPVSPQRVEHPNSDNVDQILADIKAAKTRDALKASEKEFLKACGSWPKPEADLVEAAIANRRKELA